MTHLARITLVLGLAGLLQACQLGPPGGQTSTDVTANAITGDAIEVTALDAPAGGANAPPPTALATAAPQGASPVSAADGVAADGAPAPIPGSGAPAAGGQAGTAGVDAGAQAEPEPAALPEPKSERQLACERKRGNWVIAVGTLKACVFPTRDSGKRCERESQCEGVCLARSGTCSPVKPLYGCNEILQDNGARVTLCLE